VNISVCCPSYRRPSRVETFEYLPTIRAYVAPEELEAYRASYPERDVVACAPGVQGNLCRVRNHIIDRELVQGDADVLVILDDDFHGLEYWQRNRRHKLATEEFLAFVEKYTIVARELGAFLWGVNLTNDKQIYREYTPFCTVAYIGGPFQAILRGCALRYDERMPLKEDYDFSLQHLNRYRCVLRVNRCYYEVRQSEQSGGCATYRNIEREKTQLELLRRKWGSEIVRIDTTDRSHSSTKKRTRIDYNPVIHPPIRGV
jgi:hypothetical protein